MIFFLYGPDTYRSRKKLEELKQKFAKEVDPTGSSIEVIDGETTDINKINEAISPSSLFARRRMVVIENIFSAKKTEMLNQVLELLTKIKKNEKQDNIIIIWDNIESNSKGLIKNKKALFEFLRAEKFSQEFETLSNTQAASWAKKEIETRGGKITLAAATRLVSLIGSDLWSLNNEMDKLLSYKNGQTGSHTTEIDIKDIEEMTRGSYDENIFALTDAITNGNKKFALKLLEEQIQAGLSEQYIFSMVLRQFRILLQVREALDVGLSSRQILNQLKLHSFVVQKSVNQVRNYSSALLKKIYSQLVEIDYKNKIGQGDLRTMLDLFVINL